MFLKKYLVISVQFSDFASTLFQTLGGFDVRSRCLRIQIQQPLPSADFLTDTTEEATHTERGFAGGIDAERF